MTDEKEQQAELPMSKQRERASSVAAAAAVLATLERKREVHLRAGVELQDERTALAFSAHANNDAKAKSRLEQVHAAIATHASELASLDAALRAASERVERARQAEALSADKQAALALRKSFAEFVALAEALDETLAQMVSTATAMGAKVNEIHACGSQAPTGMQWLSMGERALGTALMLTPWRRAFAHLPPNERHGFAELACGWAGGAERGIAQRLGEQTNEHEAA